MNLEDIRRIFPKVDIPILLEKVVGDFLELDDENITVSDALVLADLNLLLAGTPSR